MYKQLHVSAKQKPSSGYKFNLKEGGGDSFNEVQ